MAENNGAMDEAQTYNLEVDADTVINGLKINARPGEERVVLFRPSVGGGYGEGSLADVRGMHWDGEAPPQLAPRSFLPAEGGWDYNATINAARSQAEREGEDPDEWQETAEEVWEDDARRALKDQIVVEPISPEGSKTVYNIEYVGDDE